jgi:hypothetical protein
LEEEEDEILQGFALKHPKVDKYMDSNGCVL